MKEHFFAALNALLALYQDALDRNDVQAQRYYALAVRMLLGPSAPFLSFGDECDECDECDEDREGEAA